MDLILLYRNISFGMFKDIMFFLLLIFRRLYYSFFKGNSLGNDKEYCNDMTVWRKVLEVNELCKFSNNFIYGFIEVIYSIFKVFWGKCG